jgi:hypothetical protein
MRRDFQWFCNGKCRKHPDERNLLRCRLQRYLTDFLYGHKKIINTAKGFLPGTRLRVTMPLTGTWMASKLLRLTHVK